MAKYSLEDFDKKVQRWMQTAPKFLRKVILRAAMDIVAHAQRNKLTGQVLNVKTGRLRGSVTQKVEVSPTRITAKVGTNVFYGKLHEFGIGSKERAWLRPSVKEQKEMFLRSVLNGMMESYKNA